MEVLERRFLKLWCLCRGGSRFGVVAPCLTCLQKEACSGEKGEGTGAEGDQERAEEQFGQAVQGQGRRELERPRSPLE